MDDGARRAGRADRGAIKPRLSDLRGELANVGVTDVGRNAVRMFDVVEPSLDWVALAKGHGVEAVRVTDTDQFNAAFAAGLARKGPYVIEVIC